MYLVVVDLQILVCGLLSFLNLSQARRSRHYQISSHGLFFFLNMFSFFSVSLLSLRLLMTWISNCFFLSFVLPITMEIARPLPKGAALCKHLRQQPTMFKTMDSRFYVDKIASEWAHWKKPVPLPAYVTF